MMEPHEIELEVIKYMEELKNVQTKLKNATNFYANIINENTEKIKNISQPFNEKSAILEVKIKDLVLLRAKSIKTGYGNITYTKGSTRRNWDLDKLDEVCEINPDVKEKIWIFRDEKLVDPRVTIKINTEGKSVTEI